MSVSAALAELGSREALIALAVNGGAEIADFSLRRMIERFGSDGEMREALLSRPHLPAALRSVLVALTAQALSNFVTSRSWLSSERAERVIREARESANIMISAETARDGDHAGACELVAYLRTTGQLTAGLILRSLFCGHTNLFEAALCELSGLPRVHFNVRNAVGRLLESVPNVRLANFSSHPTFEPFATELKIAGLPE
jgi:uncharacterized protein (DUF2336 family)